MAKNFNSLRAKMSPARLAQNERRAEELLADLKLQAVYKSPRPMPEHAQVIIIRPDLSEILSRINPTRLLSAKSLFRQFPLAN